MENNPALLEILHSTGNTAFHNSHMQVAQKLESDIIVLKYSVGLTVGVSEQRIAIPKTIYTVVNNMSCLIMSNGEYGDPSWYDSRKLNFQHILCTDGAAAKARELDIVPDAIIGDMDSIKADDLIFMEQHRVKLYLYPSVKDFTDTFLALEIAEKNKWKDITVWGGTGGRLDHTLANIFGAISFVKKGMRLVFEEPDLSIYLIRDRLVLNGQIGDTVSIFPMGERVSGVYLSGFKYALEDAIMKQDMPIGVSNVLAEEEGCIAIDTGILAVFHYKKPG